MSYIPFPRNMCLVGRNAELETITNIFLVKKECQRLALVGLGGVGKTQVALEFAYMVKATQLDYSIFWMPALSMESFEQACAEVARILDISQVVEDKEDAKELVKRQLSSERAGRWLLIVDNADDMEIVTGSEQVRGIADYLPHSEEGLILFTTRTQEVAVALARSDVIKMQAMSRQEAVDLLKSSLVRKDLLNSDINTTDLLNELTYLPLAIAQAAAYLNTNEISVSEYLRLLRNTEHDMVSLLSREFYDGARYRGSKNAVATTWLVSFNQILKRDLVAAELLSFMSCVESKAIPQLILPTVEPEEKIVHAMGTLYAYAFVVRRIDEEIYDLHRLVHMATRVWLGEYGPAVEKTEKAIRHVALVFPTDNWENRVLWRAYLPHALRLLECKEGKEVVERYKLCYWIGRCLLVDGRVGEAIRWLEECMWGRRSSFKDDKVDILASEHELARAYHADGQVGKAVQLLEHVVAVGEVILGKEHLDRLSSQQELARAYQTGGQVAKAVDLLEHVVAVKEKVLMKEDPRRLVSQHALAIAYRADGQVAKAIELQEQVAAIHGKVLAEEHPHRLASQHALAISYRVDGQVAKAVELLEHVVAVSDKVQAEEHLDRLSSQQALARTYQADGQVAKAVELLKHVVTVREKVQAEENPDRLASQHALAIAYRADGQVGKAVQLLEHVVAVKTRVLRDDDPSRLVSQNALAAMYAELTSNYQNAA